MQRLPSHDPYNGPQPNQRQRPYETRPVGDTLRKQSGSLLRRGKTLTRPERAVAPVPLINPRLSTPGLSNSPTPGGALGSRGGSSGGNVLIGGTSTVGGSADGHSPGINWWKVSSTAVTWWIPNFALVSLLKLNSDATRQAWKEKVTFCWLAVILGAGVGFVTMGLQSTLCPASAANSNKNLSRIGKTSSKSLEI
jgi:chitin synthase